MKNYKSIILAGVFLLASCGPVSNPSKSADIIEHKGPLKIMQGEWAGTARGLGPDGKPYIITQTERVGSFLSGELLVIEGLGFRENGEPAFNAFGVISRTADGAGWELRSYTDGRSGTFPITLTETGYSWFIPAGPDAKVEYVAEIDGQNWRSVGHYVPAEGNKRQIFEMNLTRIGDTAWPVTDQMTSKDIPAVAE